MDRTEAIIFQHLYLSDIKNVVRKEVGNCDTFRRLKKIRYGKLKAKLAEEIPWNKLCVYLICTCIISRKGQKETYI